MQGINRKNWMLLIVAGFCFSWTVNGQNNVSTGQISPTGRTMVRVEQPVPDYSWVADSVILPGIIRIRMKDDFSDILPLMNVAGGFDSLRPFGIPAIDDLNKRVGVKRAKQTFFIALRDKTHEARHREWGLHLWYDLTVGADQDLRRLTRLYAALDEVATVELLVKARLESTGTGPKSEWLPDDSLFSLQWHYHNTGQTGGTPDCDIDLPEAWELEKGDTGVIVAIMDQGVEYDHPDLEANMWPGIGYNFYADTTVVEKCLHGTHVAGTIAANTDNGIGVSGIAGGGGSGDGVRIMSCQIISSDNQVIEANIPNAFIWAADRGAAISQNSWNFPLASPSLFEAIDYFIANGGGSAMDGGILICSAGNADTNEISYPACYAPCIAVAATSHQDIRSFFSNYGSWVSISAPGGNHYPFNEEDILSTVPGGGYGYLMGTSMACPHVSGVAALVVSLAKGLLNPVDLKDILLNSTDDISSLNPGYEGMLGTGRLNAYKALLLTRGYMAPDIPKPVVAFSAVAGGSGTVNLHWEPNATQDSVLLAFSKINKFGPPVGNYNPGDSMIDGGRVLYKGKLSEFVQSGLDSGTVCFYRIWSLRNATYSLIARSANDTVHSSPYGVGDLSAAEMSVIHAMPNPVSSVTTIKYATLIGQNIRLSVSDFTGREIMLLQDGYRMAGSYEKSVDMTNLPCGIYTIQLRAGSQLLVKKLLKLQK